MSDATASSPIVSPQRPSTRITAAGAVIGVLVALVLALVAGGYLLYTSEEKALAESRQANAAVSEQLGKSQQETRDRQADLDSTKQQLASSQAETADARAQAKSLTDQLAQSQQQAQQADALVKSLQGEKSDLSTRLASAQKSAQDAQAASDTLKGKSQHALSRAQLVEEFLTLWAKGDDFSYADLLAWFRKVYALNDSTVTQYSNDYSAAVKSHPTDAKKNNEAFATMIEKIVVYLSGSVVDDIQ
jgi:DNA repair exonuclease SbcCD ATPase subunit